MDKDVLTVRDVAQRLEIGLALAYTIVRDGTVPSKRIGRKYLIPRVRFERWLQEEQHAEAMLTRAVAQEEDGEGAPPQDSLVGSLEVGCQ
jgi:excisionase family DNA binding protein